MSYDFDDTDDRSPPRIEIKPMDPVDLEALVVVLEISAVFLTPAPGHLFTEEALFREARGLVDDPLNETDLRLVLNGLKFLERVGDKLRMK